MKPTLLIAGGGLAEVPFIKAGQRLGYHVVTTGNRAGDIGHRYADATELADYSSADEMLTLARSIGAELVHPCANDFSALSVSAVAHELGMPGYDDPETAAIIHHKDRFRALVREMGLPTPTARSFDNEAEAIDYATTLTSAWLVKPVDLTGGKGVQKVESPDTAPVAIAAAFESSRSKRVVIETFIEGSRHGLSTLIVDGRVVFSFYDDEYYFLNPYLVAGAFTPGSAPVSAIDDVIAQIERVADRLSLVDGIVHAQFILGADGPVMIELCRRPPGDLYVRLMELAVHEEYSQWVLEIEAGRSPQIPACSTRPGIIRHCMMPRRSGAVTNVVIDPSIERNVIETWAWWEPGYVIENHMNGKAGICFLEFDDLAAMRGALPRIHDLIDVQVAG